jgi:hypothetical protein
MDYGEIKFTLPLGYVDKEGVVHRSGKMRPATAHDELKVQENMKNSNVQRYSDILMLSRVIVKLGSLKEISPAVIEGLYEVDFLYLQMLYREVNSTYERKVEARCPACGNIDEINMASLFENMHYYFAKPEKKTENKTKSEKKGTLH